MNAHANLNLIKFLFFGLLIVVTTSCDKDEVTPSLSANDLVGSWEATSLVHTNNANSAQSFDMVENTAEISFTVLAGGKVRTWITFGTFHDEWDAQFSITDNILTTNPVETTREGATMSVVMEGNTVTLTNVNDSFDFTLMDEPAVATTSVGLFVRK